MAGKGEGVRGNRGFPLPGTQENYNSFASRNIMMDKELEFPNGREGVRGKGEPPVPPNASEGSQKLECS